MQGEVGERHIGHVCHVAHVLQLGQGLVVFLVFLVFLGDDAAYRLSVLERLFEELGQPASIGGDIHARLDRLAQAHAGVLERAFERNPHDGGVGAAIVVVGQTDGESLRQAFLKRDIGLFFGHFLVPFIW